MENCNCNDFGNPSIMQGDQYGIVFNITDSEGAVIQPEMVGDIEIVLGQVIKKYSADELYYEDGHWLFPITQNETFELNYPQESQVRVKFMDGTVIGAKIGKIDITESRSKEVL